jgi:hypothetical protein
MIANQMPLSVNSEKKLKNPALKHNHLITVPYTFADAVGPAAFGGPAAGIARLLCELCTIPGGSGRARCEQGIRERAIHEHHVRFLHARLILPADARCVRPFAVRNLSMARACGLTGPFMNMPSARSPGGVKSLALSEKGVFDLDRTTAFMYMSRVLSGRSNVRCRAFEQTYPPLSFHA